MQSGNVNKGCGPFRWPVMFCPSHAGTVAALQPSSKMSRLMAHSVFTCSRHPRFCLQVRRVNRHHGHTGAVPSFVHGEQQARLPQEDPGQQAGGQTPVQLLPQHTQTTLSGPVWTSLLLLLLQQDSEVSGSSTARSVPLLRMGGVLGGGCSDLLFDSEQKYHCVEVF